MNYNFDKQTNRWQTNCVKWDTMPNKEVIPMWVADMDFQVAEPIIKALQQRVEQGIFGYTKVPEAYYESIIKWFNRRHNWTINREWIIYTTGVVPAISAIIKALTKPGDKVVVQTPVYNCFFSSIKNNGCELLEAPLKLIEDKDIKYECDFEELEKACSDSKAKLFILCNPHNPAGKVWSKNDLERMNDICRKHGVIVVSDEIHCELVMPGQKYTPFASISDSCRDNAVVCCSPSKSFNTAGLQIANIISNNEEIRNKIDRAINDNEICDVNPFGVEALMAAYNESGEWIEQLCEYLYGNLKALKEFFRKEMPLLKTTNIEGTYLVWVDIRPTGMTSDALTERLLTNAQVMVNSGTMYGQTAGEGFIRLNIACPRSQMMEGLKRIRKELYG